MAAAAEHKGRSRMTAAFNKAVISCSTAVSYVLLLSAVKIMHHHAAMHKFAANVSDLPGSGTS